MKKIAFLVIAAAVVLMVSGCSTVFTTQNGMLSYGEVKGTEVGEFSADARMVYIIHPSLIGLKTPNEELETIVDPALAEMGATAVTNATITLENDFLAFLASYIGFGYPKVVVTGTAVK